MHRFLISSLDESFRVTGMNHFRSTQFFSQECLTFSTLTGRNFGAERRIRRRDRATHRSIRVGKSRHDLAGREAAQPTIKSLCPESPTKPFVSFTLRFCKPEGKLKGQSRTIALTPGH